MSFNTKQQFGEVLAVVLIVGLVGLLVYLLIPTHSVSPKVAPVTVRSNTSFGLHNQPSTQTLQTTSNSTVPKATTVVTSTDSQSTSSPVTGENAMHENGSRSPELDSKISVNAQANSCTTLTKPVSNVLAKVGSALHLTPVVANVVADTANCQS